MADKVHRIHSLPSDAPWAGGLPPEGSDEHPALIRALDRVLAVQRPVVLAHLRSIRLRNPEATGDQVVASLERRYLAAITSGGAAVGATAMVPGIGTGITLALSGAETIGFLESTALFAQSIAEVHNLPIEDPNRARALVLTLMLGTEGIKLLRQLSRQFSGSAAPQSAFWGELITSTLPKAALAPVVDRLKSAAVHQLATKSTASVIGKALPFGVGAVIGAGGNFVLGRRVVTGSRQAFGPAPESLPASFAPREGARPLEHIAATALGRAATTVARTGIAAATVTTTAAKSAAESLRKKRKKD